MARPCKSLAFSGTGEYLATACENEIGVSIWSNKTLFKHVPTRNISENEIAEVDGPTASGEGGQGTIEGAFGEDEEQEDDTIALPSAEQLSEDMVTLSLVPKSRWQTLLHLELIKVGLFFDSRRQANWTRNVINLKSRQKPLKRHHSSCPS
jgi:U3 small nucleolar RNA-associated protein 21